MMQELDYIRCGDYFCSVGGGETVKHASQACFIRSQSSATMRA